MAKGVHNKTHKRNQGIKRKVLWEKIYKKRLDDTSARLMKRCYGTGDDEIITNKKSAFRFPNDPNAVFHQHPEPIYIDKRSNYVNPDYLIRERGMKDRNIKKLDYEERLSKAMKGELEDGDVEMDNENKVIDLNQIYKNDTMKLDDDGLESVKKPKKIKKVVKNEDKMDIDEDKKVSERKQKTYINKAKKKKNKSYYIVNYC